MINAVASSALVLASQCTSKYPKDRLREILAQPKMGRGELLSAARAVYGDTLLDLMGGARLTRHWPNTIQRYQALVLLLALGSAVTLFDLEGLSEKRASDLSDEEIDALVRPLRNPEEIWGGGPVWDELQPHFASLPGPEKRCLALARQDYGVRQTLLHGRPESDEYAFAASEALAKLVAYAKPETTREGQLMPVAHEGRVVYYTLKKMLHVKGLHAYLYAPLHDRSLEAILLFRGTNGPESLKRSCLDVNGIGKTTFEENQTTLLHWLAEYASDVPNAPLRICGHSLGGADCQRLLAAIVNRLVRNPESRLKHFHHIQVNAYCSPKLDRETVDQWKMDRELYKLLATKPSLKLHRAEHRSDVITWAGDFALHDEELKSSLLLVSSTQRFPNPHQAHSLSFFTPSSHFNPQGGRSFVVIRKITEEEGVYWEEIPEEGWLAVLDKVKAASDQFDQQMVLRESEQGLRQKWGVVRFLSNYGLDPIVQVVNSSVRTFSLLPVGRVRLFSALSGPSDRP